MRNPSHFPTLPASLLHNIFSLSFYVKTTTIINRLHSYSFTSMKSKHRETLPRKYSLEAKCWIYSKVNIRFYASHETLQEVLLFVLKSANPGRTTTILVAGIRLQLPFHTQLLEKNKKGLCGFVTQPNSAVVESPSPSGVEMLRRRRSSHWATEPCENLGSSLATSHNHLPILGMHGQERGPK